MHRNALNSNTFNFFQKKIIDKNLVFQNFYQFIKLILRLSGYKS